MSGSVAPPIPAAWIVTPASEPPANGFKLWGLSSAQRLQRSLQRVGCAEIHTLEPQDVLDPGRNDRILLLRSDWIYDERLIEALGSATDTGLRSAESDSAGQTRFVAANVSAGTADSVRKALQTGAEAPEELSLRKPTELAPSYSAKLRKFDPPYLLRACPEQLDEIEKRTFSASYKGATDLVTKWVWPAPARALTRHLARAHVHPNTVTLVSWVMAIAAFWLFWQGEFGIGLVTAWLMTFLDTVDGKLARVTLTSSPLGNVLDHGLDLVHPPFWWYAWGVGIQAATGPATLIVIAGYFAGRLIEGLFLFFFKFETHSWRPIDTLFRTLTARRNPNLIFLSVGTAAGRPDLGMVLVALWTVASLTFHSIRLLQAAIGRARGKTICPWDEAQRSR